MKRESLKIRTFLLIIFSGCLFCGYTQSLGWTKTNVIKELNLTYDVKNWTLKKDKYQQEYIEVTYRSTKNMMGYYFEDGKVTQINIVTYEKDANEFRKQFNDHFTITGIDTWEDTSKGTRIYVRIYKLGDSYGDNYLTVFSFYPLKDI